MQKGKEVFSVYLSPEQRKILTEKWNCSEEALGKKLKEFAISEMLQKYQKVDQLSTEELKEKLHIKRTTKNQLKIIRSKGLHFVDNVNLYIAQFQSVWKDDPYKIYEFIVQMKAFADEELLTRELVFRISGENLAK